MMCLGAVLGRMKKSWSPSESSYVFSIASFTKAPTELKRMKRSGLVVQPENDYNITWIVCRCPECTRDEDDAAYYSAYDWIDKFRDYLPLTQSDIPQSFPWQTRAPPAFLKQGDGFTDSAHTTSVSTKQKMGEDIKKTILSSCSGMVSEVPQSSQSLSNKTTC